MTARTVHLPSGREVDLEKLFDRVRGRLEWSDGSDVALSAEIIDTIRVLDKQLADAQLRNSRPHLEEMMAAFEARWLETEAQNDRLKEIISRFQCGGSGVNAETPYSVQTWAWNLFGPGDVHRLIRRAAEEWAEMEQEIMRPSDEIDWKKVMKEAMDTVIVLLTIPGSWAEVERIMYINRYERTWNVNPDGTGYHVKGETNDKG